MAAGKVTVNRAPVLTLWAAVVAERMGFEDPLRRVPLLPGQLPVRVQNPHNPLHVGTQLRLGIWRCSPVPRRLWMR